MMANKSLVFFIVGVVFLIAGFCLFLSIKYNQFTYSDIHNCQFSIDQCGCLENLTKVDFLENKKTELFRESANEMLCEKMNLNITG